MLKVIFFILNIYVEQMYLKFCPGPLQRHAELVESRKIEHEMQWKREKETLDKQNVVTSKRCAHVRECNE